MSPFASGSLSMSPLAMGAALSAAAMVVIIGSTPGRGRPDQPVQSEQVDRPVESDQPVVGARRHRRPGPSRPGPLWPGSRRLRDRVRSGAVDERLPIGFAMLIGALVVIRLGALPTLALAVGALVLGHRLGTRKRAAGLRAIDRAIPDLIDLLRVAVASGQTVPVALATTAERAPVPLRPAMMRARRRIERGTPIAEAVGDLGTALGSLGPMLCELLLDAHRSGAAAGPPLGRMADAARDVRRREAEARANRLPVLLILPLVGCTLPAFGALAVVPLIAAALSGLP